MATALDLSATDRLVLPLDRVCRADIARVGGKNASLGELMSALRIVGVRVPDGFATTADAYRALIDEAGLGPRLAGIIAEYRSGRLPLNAAGTALRALILDAPLPARLEETIRWSYRELGRRTRTRDLAVAVRSSATAEDLADASFAGQHDSFLNVSGEAALFAACKRCFASLFNDRAIAYREAKGFDHLSIALSIGVQRMVRADLGGAGVIFTLDPDTGFPRTITITAGWGLGETVVKGHVDPDSHLVYKPALADPRRRSILSAELGGKAEKLVLSGDGDDPTRLVETSAAERSHFVLAESEVVQLAHWAMLIEEHYGQPMDIEWAKDGETGELFIVQARPETVHAARASAPLRSWKLAAKPAAPALASGIAIGTGIASGPAHLIRAAGDAAQVPAGAILVAPNTDPDWLPAMRRAAGIVTDHGGKTSHAAIVARELGIPAIVGAGDATAHIPDGERVTLSCAEGETGRVWPGEIPFASADLEIAGLPRTRTRLMLNLADPAAAFRWWRLPAAGIGLARMEFLIADRIRIHPLAAAHPERVSDPAARAAIEAQAARFGSPADYFVDTLAAGLARLAATFDPEPAIVRLSDFKSNEYARLLGGDDFEPREENPMIGFRGACRYDHPDYRDGFALECRAIRMARELYGFRNIAVMVPFCRTVAEADRVIAALSSHGLVRGDDGLLLYMMCEVPANVVLAEEFARRFDGFSIGSNDLTQLLLGVDRDSELLADLFDETDPAVTRSIAEVIRRGHQAGITIGICGQAPSDHPEFAAMLVREGIDSMSLNPDSFAATLNRVAEEEARA